MWRSTVNEETVALVNTICIWLLCVWVAMMVGTVLHGSLLLINVTIIRLHMDTVALMVWPIALIAVRILSMGPWYEWCTICCNIWSVWIATILIGVWSWLTLNGQQKRCTRKR